MIRFLLPIEPQSHRVSRRHKGAATDIRKTEGIGNAVFRPAAARPPILR